MDIIQLTESKRGCGYRQPGGKYLMGGKLCQPCGKLPLPLTTCPCCGAGIKASKGWTWVNAAALFQAQHCQAYEICKTCPLQNPPSRAGLLWIGSGFYATPEVFMAEAAKLGISRRIPFKPSGLIVGETLVLLAHRQVQITWGSDPCPAVFASFIPTHLDYVVTGEETPAELDHLDQAGFRLVRITRQ